MKHQTRKGTNMALWILSVLAVIGMAAVIGAIQGKDEIEELEHEHRMAVLNSQIEAERARRTV